MPDRALIPVLVSMMLLTGVCNTLLTKYQDLQCVRDCDSPDPARRKHFEQPVLQTAQMFVGEMGCFLIVGLAKLWKRFGDLGRGGGGRYAPIPDSSAAEGHDGSTATRAAMNATAAAVAEETEPLTGMGPDGEGHHVPPKIVDDDEDEDRPGRAPRLTGWPLLLLALPAAADIAGTTLMNVGLLFVAASIYQMTRGALVLFVGLFSVIFLRRKLGPTKWLSLVVVVVGVALVGLAGALQRHPQRLPDGSTPEVPGGGGQGEEEVVGAVANDAVRTVLGVLMIAFAQVFTASQFVLEEFILNRWRIDPIRVVGWEGVFGLGITAVGMAALHAAVGSTPAGRYGYFDAVEGWRQFTSDPTIFVSSLLIMVSIGGFNFFGLTVTHTISATSRSTIDTSRTLFIWIVSLGLGWESFKWLQVVGFALLVYGTFLFNDVIAAPWDCWRQRRQHHRLLPSTAS